MDFSNHTSASEHTLCSIYHIQKFMKLLIEYWIHTFLFMICIDLYRLAIMEARPHEADQASVQIIWGNLTFLRIRTSGLKQGVLEKGALDNRLTLVNWNQIIYLTYKNSGKTMFQLHVHNTMSVEYKKRYTKLWISVLKYAACSISSNKYINLTIKIQIYPFCTQYPS